MCATSCDNFSIDKKEKETEVKVVEYDFDQTKANSLVSAYADISKEDCLKLNTLFRGIALYYDRVVVGPQYTNDVFQHFAKTRDSYGWKPEKYTSLTDATEAYLKEKGFTDPTWKFEEHKLEMISAFNTLAKAAELAYLQKNES
jgi:hypothetical protein